MSEVGRAPDTLHVLDGIRDRPVLFLLAFCLGFYSLSSHSRLIKLAASSRITPLCFVLILLLHA